MAISKLVEFLSNSDGFARPNKFLVHIYPPRNIVIKGRKLTYDNNFMNKLNLFCNKAELPSKDVNATDHMTYGPRRQMPYAYSYNGNMELSFYLDKSLTQKTFFEAWQQQIFNEDTHNMNFYDSYISTIDIYQLSGRNVGDKNSYKDEITYACRLYEAYPQTIGSMALDYNNNDSISTLPVTMTYKYWKNIALEQIKPLAFSDFQQTTQDDIDRLIYKKQVNDSRQKSETIGTGQNTVGQGFDPLNLFGPPK